MKSLLFVISLGVMYVAVRMGLEYTSAHNSPQWVVMAVILGPMTAQMVMMHFLHGTFRKNIAAGKR